MAIVSFTLNEDAVAALRDALICLNKFSDDVSFEAQKDKLILTALNSSKSAYACFSFATSKFCARYNFEGNAQHRERYYCTLYIRALISIFRSRAGGEPQRDREKDTSIDRCEVTIEDGEALSTRFIAKLIFRNGMASTHRMPFEVAVPVHAKFNREEATNHWTMPSRTLRQLMEHFGPGVELLDISSNGEHVKFTCFTEKTVNDEVLKKPLHTSIAVDVDEFDDLEIEDNLHVVMNVRDFRAIIQHAGIAGNNLTAQYSTPARPVMLTYPGDAVNCEFLLMTVGERSGNPTQKTKRTKGANGAKAAPRQQLEAASRRQSAAPSEAASRREPSQQAGAPEEEPPRGSAMAPPPPPTALSARHTIQATAFDLRPSQRPPPPATMRSEGLFVDDDNYQWEPVRDEEEEDDDNTTLEWDHSAQRDNSGLRLSRPQLGESGENSFLTQASSAGLEPTQQLSEVQKFGLFWRSHPTRDP